MRDHNLSFRFAEAELSVPLAVRMAVAQMAATDIEGRGAIYTRREVVDFVLDLVGYSGEQKLHEKKVLEPSFGGGDFLFGIVKRLLTSFSKDETRNLQGLKNSLRAVELHRITFDATRAKLGQMLIAEGLSEFEREALLSAWLRNGDFLLEEFETSFDFVVGNPPYVRQELIPDVLLGEYRRRFETIYDRADLYVPFIERSLTLLAPKGELGFICADRWMKNRYGGPLRKFVAEDYHLKCYVDMVNTPAFHSDVIAYPAITVISREKGKDVTRLAYRPKIEAKSLATLAQQMRQTTKLKSETVKEISAIALGSEPWILDSSGEIEMVRRLESEFPTLEAVGCRVGIGVATGADKVFIGNFDELDVEDSRKLPLAMTRDILDGTVKWRGFGVINPFEDEGQLVELSKYPRLRAYLEQNREDIKARHVSKKNPLGWYRTIDRITPALAKKPKLLIPDIKGEAHVVFEKGMLYPHHNLYFITSDEWDLKALQAVLMSGIARLFVATYSTRMHGGFLRFQAQYLRRIRIPRWSNVPITLQRELIVAAKNGDVRACNAAVFKIYNLTPSERSVLSGSKK